MLRSRKYFLPFRFSNEIGVCIFYLSHACYMPVHLIIKLYETKLTFINLQATFKNGDITLHG
jgi:hypothetical protein